MTTMDLQPLDATALEFADSRPASFIEPAWMPRRAARTDAGPMAARRRFEPAPAACAADAAAADVAGGWLARWRLGRASQAELDAEIDALSAADATDDRDDDRHMLLHLAAGVAVSVCALAVACFLVGGL
jgi:hypothetical protein